MKGQNKEKRPAGVHKARLPEGRRIMSTNWWKKAVVYQIYPRSFCDSNGDGIGDLNGITGRLDYLKTLGVDVLWLSPVYQSPNADNGYDISDYRAIMKEFGTMEDFERLLCEAHKRGLRIVMDLVVNHTSDEHAWFRESRKSENNPYRDYYIWKKGKDSKPPNNWGSWFYGSAWEYDQQTDSHYLHIFSKKQPDLNWENPKVRREIYDMMTWWLEKGVDGFRMDVISLISKNQRFPDGQVTGAYGEYGDLTPYCENGPRVHEYLQEMNREVLSRYDIMTVGETPNATVEEAARYTNAAGTELNMVFQFEHVAIDHGPYGKYTENRFQLSDLIRVMSKWQEGLSGVGWNSLYWENHDQPRSVSRFGNASTPFLWEKSAKMLATCLHMLQGTPYIYQGQELGMTNPNFSSLEDYPDIDARQAYELLVKAQGKMSEEEFLRCVQNLGRDNGRTPMQWSGQKNGGFTAGEPWIKVNPNYQRINAQNQVGRPDSVFSYYQRLIRLRKTYEIITEGTYELLDSGSNTVWAYQRVWNRERLLVLANFSDQEACCPLAKNPEVTRQILISNYDDVKSETLRPYEAVAFYERERADENI